MKKSLLTILILAFFLAPLTSLAQTTVTNNFYVDSSFDIAGREKVSATLKYESQNAYFYVEDGSYNSLPSSQKENFNIALADLAIEFDTNIYPRLRSVYGPELNPGIDNDSKITILIGRTRPDIAGYFLERNQLLRSQNISSNEREILYLNSETVFAGSAKIHIAHEFAHLIEYNQRAVLRQKQERWLSEGLADYAPTLLGYNSVYQNSYLEGRVEDFLSFPHDSLIGWKNTPNDMAISSVFVHYLVGQYGENVLTEIMRSPESGSLGITQAFVALGVNEDFRDAFTNWTVANYINSSGQYAYKIPNLGFNNLHISTPLQYSIFKNSEITTNLFVANSATAWLKFVPGQLGANGKNILKVGFFSSQNSSEFEVPYVVTDIFGKSQVRFIQLNDGKGEIYVENFGTQVLSVVVIPSNYYYSTSASSLAGSFTIKIGMVDKIGSSAPEGDIAGEETFADGALLRAIGDTKVYVYKNPASGAESKRWIPSPEIFNGYGHLRWQDIIDVDPAVISAISESRLIKFIGDYRVYELSEDATIKSWLDITPAQFNISGRSWNAIFEVNQNEYDWYATGTSVLQ